MAHHSVEPTISDRNVEQIGFGVLMIGAPILMLLTRRRSTDARAAPHITARGGYEIRRRSRLC
jgi:hypothetical protein